MKHALLFEAFERLKAKPHLMRKVKIFAVVGVVLFLVTGGLMVWAGVSAVKYLASTAHQVIQSPVTQGHVKSLKTELNALPQAIPKLQALGCWGKAQSLFSIQPWIERPVLYNLLSLKQACFEQNNDQSNSDEGSFI